MSSTRLILVLAVFLFSVAATSAQSLSGRVTDAQGAAIAGADVRLTSAMPGAPRATRSGGDGSFSFDRLPAGTYTLRVDAPGFTAWTQDVAVLSVEQTVPITLQVAGLSEDVRVTADAVDMSLTKTNIPLRDQPMNVSTISSHQLQLFAVNDLVTALASVPGVSTYQQYGVYEHYTLRGFSEGAQMMDGIRNEGNRVRTVLTNVERIEVLKGPSSVISGNEAIGSSVNIVTKKPSTRPLYEGSVTYGSWNTTRASGGATGRMANTPLLYRVDAGIDVADNFRHDPWNKFNVTPSLQWRFGRTDTLDVRYSFSRNDVSGDSGIPVVPNADGTFSIPDVPRDRRYNTPQDFALSYDQNIMLRYSRQLGDHIGFQNVYSPRVYDDEYWIAETFAVPLNSTNVNRTFLYFKHQRRPWTNISEVTGDFRLGVRHRFLAGWDHQDYHSRTTRSNNANLVTTPINLFNPVETHTTWTDFTVSRYDHSQNYTEGFYGQDHVELGSKVKAVVLVRGDYVDRSTYNNPVVNGVEGAGIVTKSKQRRYSSRYGVVYQPATDVDFYGQYATSFKPNFSLQPDGSELKPEIGAQWEIGNRVRLAGSRMYVNTSVYHIERQNVALSRPGGFFDQAGLIRSQGLEVEFDGRWGGLRLNAGYGYTDADYLDYITTSNAGVQTVLSGKTKPRTPRNTFSYQAEQVWQSGLSLAVAGRSHGKQFLDDLNTLSFERYSLLDLAASYRKGNATYSLNFSNLTNTEYWASIRGPRQFYPGEPLRVMGTIRLLMD
jgi:iron complex outermembrane receptor protein